MEYEGVACFHLPSPLISWEEVLHPFKYELRFFLFFVGGKDHCASVFFLRFFVPVLGVVYFPTQEEYPSVFRIYTFRLPDKRYFMARSLRALEYLVMDILYHIYM